MTLSWSTGVADHIELSISNDSELKVCSFYLSPLGPRSRAACFIFKKQTHWALHCLDHDLDGSLPDVVSDTAPMHMYTRCIFHVPGELAP
jgi:hypothetical protein